MLQINVFTWSLYYTEYIDSVDYFNGIHCVCSNLGLSSIASENYECEETHALTCVHWLMCVHKHSVVWCWYS